MGVLQDFLFDTKLQICWNCIQLDKIYLFRSLHAKLN